MTTVLRAARGFFLAALASFLAPPGSVALAQSTLRTVILEDHQSDTVTTISTFDLDKHVEWVFRTGALPQNATVTGAAFQLVASGLLDNSDIGITVKVKTSGEKWEVFGGQEFAKDTPLKNERVIWKADEGAPWFASIRGGGQTTLTLAVDRGGTQTKRTRQWYSWKAESVWQQPRLILDYTKPGWTEPRQAVGLVGVESPRAFVPTWGDTQPKWGTEVSLLRFPVRAMHSDTPAFGHGLVYVVTGSGQSTSIEARLPVSGDLVWSEPAPDAGQHILLAPSNRLYVVGTKQIFAYEIDPQNPLARPKSAVASTGQPLLQHPPAVGPDGSLYLVSSDRLFALNPDLVEVWSEQLLDNRIGPITVDPSGRFVYLTSAVDGLLAFNAQTGQKYSIPLTENQRVLQSFDQPALHAPVVERMDDGTRNIFVATSSGANGTLTLVKNGMMRSVAPDSLKSDVPPLEGLWSQVLPQPLTTVQGDVPGVLGIFASSATAGASDLMLVRDGTVGARMSVTMPEPGIWETAGRPVVDARGAMHLWNGQQAYRIRNVLTRASVEFQFPQAGRAPNARLMFGSDGTLYAHNPDDLSLNVVLPQVVLDGQQNVAINAPMHIAVQGHGGSGTTIKAHGTVAFLPDTTLAVLTQVHTGLP